MDDPTETGPPTRPTGSPTAHDCRQRRVVAPSEARDVGTLGERLAVDHLRDDGLHVLATNWRIAHGALRGELDVVAVDPRREQLVVCEVKTRRDRGRHGGAIEALGSRQRDRIRRLAAAFLCQSGLTFASVRFDLVAVDLADGSAHLDHVRDAW